MTERMEGGGGEGRDLTSSMKRQKTNIYFSDIPIYVFAFVVEMLKNGFKRRLSTKIIFEEKVRCISK